MRLAYSYMRFSSDRQQWGDSLARQIEATRRFCERHKLTLDTALSKHHIGSAFRGANLREGPLGAFLEAIKLKKVPQGSVLIVENFDRFSRAEPMEAMAVFSEIINAGVAIATTSQDQIIDKKTMRENQYQLMFVVGELIRAHGESLRKSEFGQRNWTMKRSILNEKKLTGRVPAWLKLNPDKKSFSVDDEKAKVVKLIFAKAMAGYGVQRLTRFLNEKKIPTLGHGVSWGRSSIMKIVRNRAVIGEFIAHSLDFTSGKKKRKPQGPAIAGYYPSIVSEDDFNRVQLALDSRKNQKGPVGKGVANLFTGLIYDTDGRTMQLTNKGAKSLGKKLVNAGAIHGADGTKYMSFSYDLVEVALLKDFSDIKVSDLQGVQQDDPIEPLENKLKLVTAKIAKFQKQMAELDDNEDLLPVLNSLTKQKKEIMAQLEQAKREAASTVADALVETQSLLALMASDNGDELRTKIRAKVRQLVERINMTIWDEVVEDFGRKGRNKTFRFCQLQIMYKTGETRRAFAEEKSMFIMADDGKMGPSSFDMGERKTNITKTILLSLVMLKLGRKDLFQMFGQQAKAQLSAN